MLNNTIREGVLDKDSLLLPDGRELQRVRGTCFTCPEVDLPHQPFVSHHNPSAPAYAPLEKVYTDILYTRESGQGAYNYVITFIDAATRYVWHLNLPSHDMAFEAFVAWLPRQRQLGPPAPATAANANANANSCTQRRSLHLRHRQRQRRQQLTPPPPLPLPSRSFCRGRGGDVGVAGVTDQQPVPPFPLPLSTAALVAMWEGGEERGVGGMREVKGGRQRVAEEAATHLQLPPSAPVVLPLSPAVPPPLPPHALAL
ncbi:unnamed protein product [Closterium sp. NIES-53]